MYVYNNKPLTLQCTVCTTRGRYPRLPGCWWAGPGPRSQCPPPWSFQSPPRRCGIQGWGLCSLQHWNIEIFRVWKVACYRNPPRGNKSHSSGSGGVVRVIVQGEVIFYGRAACCTYHCTPFNLGLLDANAWRRDSVVAEAYRARKYGLYVVWWNLFLHAKQQQEQISLNHAQAIFLGSVLKCNFYFVVNNT